MVTFDCQIFIPKYIPELFKCACLFSLFFIYIANIGYGPRLTRFKYVIKKKENKNV